MNRINNTGARVGRPSGIAAAVAVALAGFASAPAHAFRFDLGNGIEGNFDSVLSVGLQARMEKRDCRYVGYDNGGCAPYQMDADVGFLNSDDGNLNYDQGDIFSAAIRGVHDLQVSAPGGWTAFMRGAWFSDLKVDDTRRTDIPGGRADAVAKRDAEILDAYIQKRFDIAERPVSVRVGKQVLTWGESVLTFGGINDINSLDFRKAFSAGVQLKELFRPSNMIDVSASVTDNLGIEGYYIFGFDQHVLPAAGTYFSPFDMGVPGGNALYVGTPSLDVLLNGSGTEPTLPPGVLGDQGTINVATGQRFTREELENSLEPGVGTVLSRGEDLKKNSGQFGLAARYTFEESGDELGLYYIRYHEKTPTLAWRASGGNTNFALGYSMYHMNFVPDRDLWGISYNTLWGDWSIGMEASYRPNQAIMVDQSVPLPGSGNEFECDGFALPEGTVCPGYDETERWQFTINGLSILKPHSFGGLVGKLGASDGLAILEFTVSHLPNLDLRKQPEGHGTNTTVKTVVPYLFNYDFSAPTKTTTGMSALFSLTYPNVFGTRATVVPEIGWNHGFSGSPATFFPGFAKDSGSITAGLNFDFKTKPGLTARIDYTHFYGGGQGNPMLDKDYMGISVSTAF